MRYSILLVLATALAFSNSYAQRTCPQHSILYHFEKDKSYRNFTEKLGNHPEFEFLQKMHGVSSPETFIKAINDPANQQQYTREFKAFDLLLHNSGFENGYKDLNENNVENVYLLPGTIGNLGFYDKVKDRISYIYVKLNPAGEALAGVAAWKLTNEAGCYLYVLHTCGNAFYPNTNVSAACCKAVTVETLSLPLQLKADTFTRIVHMTFNLYQARISPSKGKQKAGGGYDTAVHFVHRIDSTASYPDYDGKQWKVFARTLPRRLMTCRDTTVVLGALLHADSTILAGSRDSIVVTLSDTSYTRDTVYEPECVNKWEFTLEGGLARNTIPVYNSAVQHSQPNGFHPAAEASVSRIINQWFQLGIKASYIILSYQDDFPYAGATPGTYSQVYLGNPIFPVQLFAKADIGKPVGWESSVAISAGYAIPSYSKIVNSGMTLTQTPGTTGGPTAGFQLGIAYFFSCKFGLGLSFGGQFFHVSTPQRGYQLFSLPITGGLRIRF